MIGGTENHLASNPGGRATGWSEQGKVVGFGSARGENDLVGVRANQSTAQIEARRLLFAAGDRPGIRAEAETAMDAGIGGLHGKSGFRFLSSMLARLPARLRVLVGCAEVLQGGAVACDFVEIDLESPRVTMIVCDDLERPVPFVLERIRVDLARLKVSVDRRDPETLPVYFKSRFLPRDHIGRDRDAALESALIATGLFETDAPEPPWPSVKAALTGIIEGL